MTTIELVIKELQVLNLSFFVIYYLPYRNRQNLLAISFFIHNFAFETVGT